VTTPDQGDPTTAVVHLLTGALADEHALQSADRDEVIAIIQAMGRLLLGSPLRSDGKLTVKTLAAEAGLRRNKLTHKHTGLKDLFYALVKNQNNQPAAVADLQAQNEQLRCTVTELRQANHEQGEMIKQLARVVHVLEVENQQLRECVTEPRAANADHSNVRFLRPPSLIDGQPDPAQPDIPTNDRPEEHR
jgi:uncharacterized protein YceH (UPF0502 family)